MTKEKYSLNGHDLDETNICWICKEDFDAKDPNDIECKNIQMKLNAKKDEEL